MVNFFIPIQDAQAYLGFAGDAAKIGEVRSRTNSLLAQ